MRKPRQYAPIWEALKNNYTVAIVAPIPLHARIIKAVIKEKFMDDGYKFLKSEQGLRTFLGYQTAGTKIVFKLTHTLLTLPTSGDI